MEGKLTGEESVYAVLVNICRLIVYFLLESLGPLTKINSEMCTFGTLKLVWLRTITTYRHLQIISFLLNIWDLILLNK